jgi:hypothetical protein
MQAVEVYAAVGGSVGGPAAVDGQDDAGEVREKAFPATVRADA